MPTSTHAMGLTYLRTTRYFKVAMKLAGQAGIQRFTSLRQVYPSKAGEGFRLNMAYDEFARERF
jgi:hypothetical protein